MTVTVHCVYLPLFAKEAMCVQGADDGHRTLFNLPLCLEEAVRVQSADDGHRTLCELTPVS